MQKNSVIMADSSKAEGEKASKVDAKRLSAEDADAPNEADGRAVSDAATNGGADPAANASGTPEPSSNNDPSNSMTGSLGLRSRLPGSKAFTAKKFPNASRFVVTSKVWMHTVPTRDCDVLMTFPSKTEDHVLLWLLSRLRTRTPELAVHVRHHSNTGVFGFYLTATYDNLLRGAEELSIKKSVKAKYGGGMKEFVYEDQDYFENVQDCTKFLISQERQSIVKNMLFNLRALDGDVLDKIKFVEGQAIVPLLESRGVVKHVLPLHNNDDLHFLRKNWVQAFHKHQPLDKICDYFGVKIAMYFAYLGHYTRALTLPAFLGMLMWFLQGRGQYTEDVCFVVFAFFNVVWATLYLEHWKRRGAEFAYQWGTMDQENELLQEPRPLFHGKLVRSKVTGRMEPDYPAWKRTVFRYFVSLPVILLCLSVVFATMWCIFELQDWVNGKIKAGDFPRLCKFLPKILLAICIGILDEIYKKIAYWLNDRENYRLDETYENNLIIKLALFQFVNSFLALFYLAFYAQDWDRVKELLAALLITRQVIGNIKEALVPYILEKIKLFKLSYEMAESMSPEMLAHHLHETDSNKAPKTSAKNLGGIAEGEEKEHEGDEEKEEDTKAGDGTVGWQGRDSSPGDGRPAMDGLRRETKEGPEGQMEVTYSGPTLTQAEVEANKKTYEDTLEDYLEMFIQFGYVTLFSSAFPMAAMCALVNNVIEIRSDAFKLCMSMQRPFSQRVENIGVWQDALEMMGVIAVMVNCALIGMSDLADRLFIGWGTTERIVFIVLLEHLVLLLKLLVAYAIPDIPQWVAEEQARLEFLRREALKKMESRTAHASVGLQDVIPGRSSTGRAQPSELGDTTDTLAKLSSRNAPKTLSAVSNTRSPITVTGSVHSSSSSSSSSSNSRTGTVGSPPRSVFASSWTSTSYKNPASPRTTSSEPQVSMTTSKTTVSSIQTKSYKETKIE